MKNGTSGKTRSDAARDKICITWSTRSDISQKMGGALYADIGYDEDEFTFKRVDFQRSRLQLDASHVQALLQQLEMLDVFCCKGLGAESEDLNDTITSERHFLLPVN